jgi:putative transposase
MTHAPARAPRHALSPPRLTAGVCIVHLLRNSFKYASKRDWAEIAKDLKPVYTAVSEAAAIDALAEFSAKWEKRYPAITRLWESAWAEFVPFLQFDNEIRSIICTTNAIWVFGSWHRPGRCFPGWRSPWLALTLNAIDAAGLSWTRSVGLAA